MESSCPSISGTVIIRGAGIWFLFFIFLFFFNSHIFIPVPRIIAPRGKGSTLRYEPYGQMPVYHPRAYERTLGGGI